MANRTCTRCQAPIETSEGWLCATCRPLSHSPSIAEMLRQARAEERVRCADIVRARNRAYVQDADDAEASGDGYLEHLACNKSDVASEIESEIRALGDPFFDKHRLFQTASHVEDSEPGKPCAAGRPTRKTL